MTKSTKMPELVRIIANNHGVFVHVGDLCDVLMSLAETEPDEDLSIAYEVLAEALPRGILRSTWSPLSNIVDKETSGAQ